MSSGPFTLHYVYKLAGPARGSITDDTIIYLCTMQPSQKVPLYLNSSNVLTENHKVLVIIHRVYFTSESSVSILLPRPWLRVSSRSQELHREGYQSVEDPQERAQDGEEGAEWCQESLSLPPLVRQRHPNPHSGSGGTMQGNTKQVRVVNHVDTSDTVQGNKHCPIPNQRQMQGVVSQWLHTLGAPIASE